MGGSPLFLFHGRGSPLAGSGVSRSWRENDDSESRPASRTCGKRRATAESGVALALQFDGQFEALELAVDFLPAPLERPDAVAAAFVVAGEPLELVMDGSLLGFESTPALVGDRIAGRITR